MSETETKAPTPEQMAANIARQFATNGMEMAYLRDAVYDALNAARETGRFDAYEKARELVGFSPKSCHVIEAQMQEEFPDRAFVPSTQERLGSRMDGSNLRMPKTPNQFREEGRADKRERCAIIATRNNASKTEEEIRALLTPLDPQEEQRQSKS